MEEITCPVCDMNHHGPQRICDICRGKKTREDHRCHVCSFYHHGLYMICDNCRDGQELPEDELVIDDEKGE